MNNKWEGLSSRGGDLPIKKYGNYSGALLTVLVFYNRFYRLVLDFSFVLITMVGSCEIPCQALHVIVAWVLKSCPDR